MDNKEPSAEEERTKRVEAFQAEFRELSQKYELDFGVKMIWDNNGARPEYTIIDVPKKVVEIEK